MLKDLIFKIISKSADYGGMIGREIFSLLAVGWLVLTNQAKEAKALGIIPPREIRSLKREGFFFGKRFGWEIVKKPNVDGHIAVFGTSGSYKTSSVFVPSILSWQGRRFVMDAKGDLYNLFKGAIENIKVLNPLDHSSYGFDPFYLLRKMENKAIATDVLARSLIPDQPEARDPMWHQNAQLILSGAFLHYFSKGLSFVETVEAIKKKKVMSLLEELSASENEQARDSLPLLLEAGERTLGNIFTEIVRNIRVLTRDLDIKDCLMKEKTVTPRDHENGFDVFVHLPLNYLSSWRPFYKMVVSYWLFEIQNRPERKATPLALFLDEVVQFGRLHDLLQILATGRSKNVTLAMSCQSDIQFVSTYGREQALEIIDNCDFTAILKAKHPETQEKFSKMVGTYEREKESQTETFADDKTTLKGVSKTTATMRDRIIQPEEFGRLKDIILLHPDGFCRVKKVPYFKDRKLRRIIQEQEK